MIQRMFNILLLLLLIGGAFHQTQAQLEKMVVETYYISDDEDATDTDGGATLEANSYVYRIYIDLAEGSRLKKIYGDANHPISFRSTEPFFNNLDRGDELGYKIKSNKLDENTVALDTWITLGFATNNHFGIIKPNDTDGSIVGGENNDGGSEGIEGGLLVNDDPIAGTPLTSTDGLVETDSSSSEIFVLGIDETSIFQESTDTVFESTDASVSLNQGMIGADNENMVLIAQLTTQGELSFRFNLEVMVTDTNGITSVIKYVSDQDTLLEGETFSNWLSYPFPSGCTDPNYLEFVPEAVNDDGSCVTPIVLGCMDKAACNYDPEVNFHLQEICCYGPSRCDNRDVSAVCPNYRHRSGSGQDVNGFFMNLFPNPVHNELNINFVPSEGDTQIQYLIYDTSGRVVRQQSIDTTLDGYFLNISTVDLAEGSYIIRMMGHNGSSTRLFTKAN